MAMYAAMEALQTAIEATAGTMAPETVNIVTQERGAARTNQRGISRWVNLEPDGEEYLDESGGSYIAAYSVKVTAWILARYGTLELTAADCINYWQPILHSFLHSRLDGYARVPIRAEDVGDVTYISGDDKDVRYGVEATVTITRQETTV